MESNDPWSSRWGRGSVKGGRGVCYINLRIQGDAWKKIFYWSSDNFMISANIAPSAVRKREMGLEEACSDAVAVVADCGGGSGGNISDVQQTEN